MLPSVLSDALIAQTMQSINVPPAVNPSGMDYSYFVFQSTPFANLFTQHYHTNSNAIKALRRSTTATSIFRSNQNPKQIHTDRYIVQLDIWGSKINRHFASKLKITWRGWWSHGPGGGGREMVRRQPVNGGGDGHCQRRIGTLYRWCSPK